MIFVITHDLQILAAAWKAVLQWRSQKDREQVQYWRHAPFAYSLYDLAYAWGISLNPLDVPKSRGLMADDKGANSGVAIHQPLN